MADPIRYYFDQHIDSAVATAMRQYPIDVLTAQDPARCGLPDSDQLQFAGREQRVAVTYDSDYLVLHNLGVAHLGIAWCPATKYSVGQLIHALLLVHGVLDRDAMRDHVEFL